MMQALHVRDAAGRWHVGVDALAVTYRAAGLNAIAWLLALPGLRPLWNRCYRWFARHRLVLSRPFRTNAHDRGEETRRNVQKARTPESKPVDELLPR